MILPPKALKLLRLALDSTHAGELEAASVKFIKELKLLGIGAEAFEGAPVPKGFIRVKREDARSSHPAPSPLSSDPSVIQTPSSPSPSRKNNPYGAYEGEQLQWVYENRHRLSKKMRVAAEEEMSARGLI